MEHDNVKVVLDDISSRLKACRQELAQINGELYTDTYTKVRKELNTAISGINRAERELWDTRQIEGQMTIEDLEI